MDRVFQAGQASVDSLWRDDRAEIMCGFIVAGVEDGCCFYNGDEIMNYGGRLNQSLAFFKF